MDEINVDAILAKKASFFSKWILVLFCISLLVILAENLDTDFIMVRFPYLIRICIRVLNLATSLLYCIVFFILSTKNKHYFITGIGHLLLMVYNIIKILVKDDTIKFALPLALLVLIITFVARYQEYKGHSEILYGVDAVLSDKWGKLWKWYIGIMIMLFVSEFLMATPTLFVMIIGLLLLIVSSVGQIVIGILRLVYLFKTSRALKTYSKMNGSADSQLSADGL